VAGTYLCSRAYIHDAAYDQQPATQSPTCMDLGGLLESLNPPLYSKFFYTPVGAMRDHESLYSDDTYLECIGSQGSKTLRHQPSPMKHSYPSGKPLAGQNNRTGEPRE